MTCAAKTALFPVLTQVEVDAIAVAVPWHTTFTIAEGASDFGGLTVVARGAGDRVSILAGPLPSGHPDCDSDGIPDSCLCDPPTLSEDCEEDCHDNAVPDDCEIAAGISLDCDENGIPDECEASPDCNSSGLPDNCDLGCGPTGGVCDLPGCAMSRDCDGNCVPDECELIDCNNNGLHDACDLADATSADCNANAVPDECESDDDCDNDGVTNICALAAGTSVDCTGMTTNCCTTLLCGPGCDDSGIANCVCGLDPIPGLLPDPSQCCDPGGTWSLPCVIAAMLPPAPEFGGCGLVCNLYPDGIPDDCQASGDCNCNGVGDAIDIFNETSLDCNENCLPDECEIDQESTAPGGPFFCDPNVPPCDEDCNNNGVPDFCDIDTEVSCDRDVDGVPDECGACTQGGGCANATSQTCTLIESFFQRQTCVATCNSEQTSKQECCGVTRACCQGGTCREIDDCRCLATGGFVSSQPLCGMTGDNVCATGVCCTAGACDEEALGFPMTESRCFGGTYVGVASCADSPCAQGVWNCDADVPDECGGPAPTVFLVSTSYACDDTLSRVGRNILRFAFCGSITLPDPGEVEVRELLEGGLLGADLTDLFDFALEGPDGFETVLRVEEIDVVFQNETWYAVLNSGNWAGVADFKVDYASVYGDANNNKTTDFGDLSAINAMQSPLNQTPDDTRFNINPICGVDDGDLSAANAFIGSTVIGTKPSGHDCPGTSQSASSGEGGGGTTVSANQSITGTLGAGEDLTTAPYDPAAEFVGWFPSFLTELTVLNDQHGSVEGLMDELVAWGVRNLSDDQRKTVSNALLDPALTFASAIVAAKVPEIASGLSP